MRPGYKWSVVQRLLRALLVVAVAFGAAGVWLWSRLAPPHVAVPAADALRIADVTVVQPGQGRQAQRTISIERGRIVSVEPAAGGVDGLGSAGGPARAHPGEASFAGDFALPGLIDMHVHHPPDTPLGDVALAHLLFLAHGVTTIRDTGDLDGTAYAARKRVREGRMAGPRVFACGPLIDGDPPFWSGSRVVHDADEAGAAVAEIAAGGADCIKVYDGVSPEALTAIQDAAAQRGLEVIGHVPEQVQFAEAHLDDVQHLTGFEEKGRPLTEARIRSVVTTSAALGIAHTPTLVVYEHASRMSDWAGERESAPAKLLPRYYREILWDPAFDRRFATLSAERWRDLEEAPAGAADVVRRLHAAGVAIHVGTDTMNPFVVPGVSLHEEMRLLVGAGLTVEEVWTAATSRAGTFLGEPGLGAIAPGAPADVLLFRADPTRDLGALETLDAVIAGGRLYTREVLDDALARWRAHLEDPVLDGLSTWAARRLAPGRTK